MEYDSTSDVFTTTESVITTVLNGLLLNATKFYKENSTSTKNTTLQLYDILIPTLGTLIILMNLAVVISSGLILKKGQEPRACYLFLGNVAMTDLVTGIFVIFGQVFPKKYRNHEVCAAQIGLIVGSTLASIYSVGLIAIDRYLYILYGLHYRQWVYPTKVRLMIGGTWILGITVGFLPLMGWSGETRNGQYCWFILLAPKYLILLTIILGCIPIGVVLVLYSILLYHSLKRIVKLQKRDSPNTNSESNLKNLRMFRGGAKINESTEVLEEKPKKTNFFAKIFKKAPSDSVQPSNKWKAIKVVLFTTSSFLITWGPYFAVSFYYVSTCDDNKSKRCKSLSIVIASPLAILGFVNSLINPIIYAWWHKGFHTFVTTRFNRILSRNSASRVLNKSGEQSTSSKNKTTSETFGPTDSEISKM